MTWAGRPQTMTDDYAPTLVTVGPNHARDLTQRQPLRAHSAHENMMLDYYSARDAWLAAREAEALGYATEEAEFAVWTPRPTLKSFMLARKAGA